MEEQGVWAAGFPVRAQEAGCILSERYTRTLNKQTVNLPCAKFSRFLTGNESEVSEVMV